MDLVANRLTVEQFDTFAALPENADKLFEFIGGEVVEVPSNPYASSISMAVAGAILAYLRGNPIAHVTGEAGGYMVSGERYAPDVGVLLKTRQARLALSGYNPLPPDLAVEVDFPSTLKSQRDLRHKLYGYQAAGVLVWIVQPDTREVEVYAPGQPPRVLSVNDALDGGAVLPGFTLPLRELFPDEAPAQTIP